MAVSTCQVRNRYHCSSNKNFIFTVPTITKLGVSIVDVTGGLKSLSGTIAKSKRMNERVSRPVWAICVTSETAWSTILFLQDRSQLDLAGHLSQQLLLPSPHSLLYYYLLSKLAKDVIQLTNQYSQLCSRFLVNDCAITS